MSSDIVVEPKQIVEPAKLVVEKRPMRENPFFHKTHQRSEFVNARFYEPIHPVPFKTRVSKLETETHEIDSEIKVKRSAFYLFGWIPLGETVTWNFVKEKVTRTAYFCEITPEMQTWIEAMNPYFLDLVRNRGRLNFIPTDEEINTKKEFQVYPFVVEYTGISGIGWKRFPVHEEGLPI